jgi:Helix-turn-helix domain
MAKSSAHNEHLPQQAVLALEHLGDALSIARLRRKQSLRAWAARLKVSVATLQRMEAGDPGVSMGVYAAALWVMGRADELPHLADPATDRGALELDIASARQRVAARRAGARE